ncbi:cell division protein FtsQ [Hypnocyclicus thermotrophus]|uniref:Cell division protein FtsQ n=1 Tax=Hypnocyclicus thermotrophus TaxID=1627895 RepID=A0AA46DYD5_9FUSO|nr:FtsQ-type POTRA domain-containing protein [Hypnocyclicus thermotrophus]TDT69860.1 cell division protein FtsQ [Hypnocyclicus thermotrophus]
MVFFKKFIPIFILFIIFYNIYFFYNSDYFLIKDIQIMGKNELLKNDIIEKLDILKSKNIWKIDIEKLKELILKDVRIEKLDIKRKIPDKLIFEIEEKKPFIYVEYKGRILVSDKNGIIFSIYKEISNEDLAIIKLTNLEDLKEYISILNKLEGKYLELISELYKKENYYIIYLRDGIKIKTDIDVEKKKYSLAFKLYNHLKNKKEIDEYLDIRFKDFIVK